MLFCVSVAKRTHLWSISLPLYLGFFEFVHNVCTQGKALLRALIELLVT